MIRLLALLVAPLLLLGACGTDKQANLLFATVTQIGIQVDGPTSATGPGVNVGYKDAAVAVIPTLDSNGSPMGGTVPGPDGMATDAYSTVVQFDAQTDASNVGVGIGKMAATGLAAQYIADGLRERLTGEAN